MKRLLTVIAFIVINMGYGQTYFRFGTDPKVSIFGTDNKFTSHEQLFNFIVGMTHVNNEKGKNIVLDITLKYVNLSEKFFSYQIGLGRGVRFSDKITGIYEAHVGQIIREKEPINQFDTRGNPWSLFGGIGARLRWMAWYNIGFEVGYGGDLATDLPKRFARHQGELTITIDL